MIVSKQRFCKDQRKKKRREEDGSNPKRSDKQTSKQANKQTRRHQAFSQRIRQARRQEGNKNQATTIKLLYEIPSTRLTWNRYTTLNQFEPPCLLIAACTHAKQFKPKYQIRVRVLSSIFFKVVKCVVYNQC